MKLGPPYRLPTLRPHAIIGRSFGGVLVQILAGRGLSSATVVIDPAPSRGVLPLPISALKSSSPILANPANRHRAIALTFEQFTTASPTPSTNTKPAGCTTSSTSQVPTSHSSRPHSRTSTRALKQKPTRRSRPRPDAHRLGEFDHQVPWAIANATFEQQNKNEHATTEIIEIPPAASASSSSRGRGHSLTIDSRWEEVTKTSLEFVRHFLQYPTLHIGSEERSQRHRCSPMALPTRLIVGKLVAGVPTRHTPRTSPTIERSECDSARHHPYNGRLLGESSARPPSQGARLPRPQMRGHRAFEPTQLPNFEYVSLAAKIT